MTLMEYAAKISRLVSLWPEWKRNTFIARPSRLNQVDTTFQDKENLMKSAQDLAKEILKKLQEKSDVSAETQIASLIQESLDGPKLKCNQCSKVIDETKEHNITKFSVNWGYESTGKDCDHDAWALCANCTKAFSELNPLLCVVCKKSIPEVMADISSKNPNSTFYGDYSKALDHKLSGSHCGHEYATINNRVVCEWCYDRLTATFEILITPQNYMISTGDLYSDEDSRSRIHRTTRSLQPHIGDCGDSLRAMYYASVTYSDAVSIRKDSSRRRRLISATVSIYRDGYQNKFGEDDIGLSLGDGSYKHVSLAWLRENSKRDLDFTKPEILDCGKTLAFGDYHFDLKTLLDAPSIS